MKRMIALALALIMVLGLGTVAMAAGTSLPAAVDGIITLTEDVTLNEQVIITQNEDTTLGSPIVANTIDLNGKTLFLNKHGNAVFGNVTIKNGTIDISGTVAVTSVDSIIAVGEWHDLTRDAHLTLDGVTLTGDGYYSSYAVIHVFEDNKLTVNNCTFDLKNDKSPAGGVIKGEESSTASDISITNTTMNLENTVRGFVHGTYGIKNSQITMTGRDFDGEVTDDTAEILDNGINGTLNITVDNSSIDISGATGRSLTLADGGSFEVKNGSNVTLGEGGEAGLRFKGNANITVDASSGLNATKIKLDDAVTAPLTDMITTADPNAVIGADGIVVTSRPGIVNPGEKIEFSTVPGLTADLTTKNYKVSEVKWTKGGALVDKVEIDNDTKTLVITLKENYTISSEKDLIGKITLKGKGTFKDEKGTLEIAENLIFVTNFVETVYGEEDVDDASEIEALNNTIYVCDEDAPGYVKFNTNALLGATLNMAGKEKAFMYTDESMIEALEDKYPDAEIECYAFGGQPTFKNAAKFTLQADYADKFFLYSYTNGKLAKQEAEWDSIEGVYTWETKTPTTYVISDVELVAAAADSAADHETKNPDTGANDVVGVAAALAVVSLLAAGAVSLKK